MSVLRLEFFGAYVDGAFPPSPIRADSLPVSAIPTPIAQQPIVPGNPIYPNKVFARVRSDRPTYVLVANVPDLTRVDDGFIVVPSQALTLRVFPGQRIAALAADDFGVFTRAQVDALIAAALAGAGPASGSAGGSGTQAPAASPSLSLSLDLASSLLLP